MVSLGEAEAFFRVALMGFALILTLLMALTTVRVRSVKLLLVTLGFAVFFAKGILLTVGLFVPAIGLTFLATAEVILLDFAILVILYAGMVKAS